jgi:hypothetical protein
MNHLPFETWLLNEQPLTPEQHRDLQSHLRTCEHCTALAEVNLTLRSAKMAAPAAGFTARFQQRLAAQRALERRNRLAGTLVLVFGGMGLTLWLTFPYLVSFLGSPAEWIAATINFMISLYSLMQTIGDVGSVLLRVLPGFVPPFAWLVVISAIGGFGLLWSVSLWRMTQLSPRSVRA